MQTKKLNLLKDRPVKINDHGEILYKGKNLNLTIQDLFNLKVYSGLTTQTALNEHYNKIVKEERDKKLEILLN